MSLVIVPDYVHEAITRKLDGLIADCPDAKQDRQHLYDQLLEYFNEHGEIPDCSIVKKGQS
jgi:hypothetical protein